MVKIQIGEFLVLFIVQHHDKRIEIIAIDQDVRIEVYSFLRARFFVEKLWIFDYATIEGDIEDIHEKMK